MAETAFKAECSNIVGNTVARPVLVARLQEEVQTGERRVNEAEQARREIEFEGKLVYFLRAYSQTERKLEQRGSAVHYAGKIRKEGDTDHQLAGTARTYFVIAV